MLPGLRDTSWPTRLAIFAALVGHAFAPRPLEGAPRSLAAVRSRPLRPVLGPDLPPPVVPARKPATGPIPGERRAESSLEPEEVVAIAAGERPVAEVRALRLSGWIAETPSARVRWVPPRAELQALDSRRPAGLTGRSWRLEGRARFGLQLGSVRGPVDDASRHDEVPPGFGLRAVLSF